MDNDRNLLFGVLALQADLVTPAQFAEACSAWAARKDTALAYLLVQRGWLSPSDRADVEKLLQRKLAKHNGDARAGLAEVTTDHVRQSLAGVDDADVRQSLAILTAPQGHVLLSTTAYTPQGSDRYTLSRLHATGGIGRVWLARDASLGRDVALKELRPERADQPALWARFLREAQITGQLEHPGIVPVYEVGRRPDEQPFYTMRFVRGRTLAEAARAYHQRRRRGEAGPLELRELLTAFVGVCQAVAYAHSRGVLHRDLKPQNVVLGDYGEVIVLDWGLAKVTGADDDAPAADWAPVAVAGEGAREETVAGQVLGTPAYMAPEQAEGRLDLLEARTDVYGLGAVLYEVLCGQPPFPAGTTTAVLRRVVHEAPAPPRAVVPGTPPALEAVCLKALAKPPQDRYASAKALAEDIERWLADEPISAWHEPVLVRTGRWVRRHRAGVLAGVAALSVAAVCLGIASGLLFAAYQEADRQRQAANVQRDKASERFRLARDAVDQFHTRVSDSRELKAAGLEPLRRELLTSAVGFFQKFVQEEANDPDLRAEQGRAYLRLAKVERDLGHATASAAASDQARALFQELADAHPDVPAYRHGLAQVLLEQGEARYASGAAEAAERDWEGARTLCQQLVAAHPAELRYQHDFAKSGTQLGRLYMDTNRFAEAEQNGQEVLAQYRRLTTAEPDEPEHAANLAITLNNLSILYYHTKRPALEEQANRDALEIRERLAKARPDVPAYQVYLATSYNNLGLTYRDTGRFPQAAQALREGLRIYQQLANRHPWVPEYQRYVARSDSNLGELYHRIGLVDHALQAFRRAEPIGQRLLEAQPEEMEFALILGEITKNQGKLLLNLGRPAEALASYERTVQAVAPVRQKAPQDVSARAYVLYGHAGRSMALSQLGRFAEAEQALRAAVALGKPTPDPRIRFARALLEARRGDYLGAVKERGELLKEDLDCIEQYWMATLGGLLATAVRRDGRLSSAEQQRQSEEYLAAGMTALREAAAAGYFQTAVMREELRRNPELASLRVRPEFAQLLADLDSVAKRKGTTD
jgi:serine/threonine-protein kinase